MNENEKSLMEFAYKNPCSWHNYAHTPEMKLAIENLVTAGFMESSNAKFRITLMGYLFFDKIKGEQVQCI